MKIAVFFETSACGDLARMFNTEAEYLLELPKLEELAVNEGYGYVTESVLTSVDEIKDVLLNCSGVSALYSRVCDITNQGTNEGFVINGLLVKDEDVAVEQIKKELAMTNTFTGELTNKQVLEMSYNEEIHYWSEWYLDDAIEEDDFYIELTTGEVVHIDDFNDFV